MLTTQERLDSIDSRIAEIAKAIKGDSPSVETEDIDPKFKKRRMSFVGSGTAGFMILTYLFYLNFLPLFNIAFGLMLAFMCMALVILFDEYILPGDTIGKISNNAIASAIVILAFAVIVIGGAQIGSGLITNRATAEEATPERIEKVIGSKSANSDLQTGGQQQDSSSKNQGKEQ